jgi:hypothetical protein
MGNGLHSGYYFLHWKVDGFACLCKQFFAVNEYQDVLRAASAVAVTYRSEANCLASASCELSNQLAMDAQLRSNVVDESLLVGSEDHEP